MMSWWRKGKDDEAPTKSVDVAAEPAGNPKPVKATAGTRSGGISMIPEGINITGNIEGAGHLRVDGSVRGDVRLEGRLEVGQSGRVEGDLHGEDIVILGEVRGNVLSQNKLLLKAKCKVHGNVSCRGLIVEEGAWITGRCEMGKQDKSNISKRADIKTPPPSPPPPRFMEERKPAGPGKPGGTNIQTKAS